MNINPSRKLLATLLASLVMGAGSASAAIPLPPSERVAGVEYLSGGIGKDEVQAIKAVERQWPLTLEFAIKDSSRAIFAANVKVLMRDDQGQTVLEKSGIGPLLLVRLKPGHYSIEAKFSGNIVHEKVQVIDGNTTNAVILWPAGTGESKTER